MRGDRQIAEKDYQAFLQFATVRILIALATEKNWKLHQLDINNAFLHGTLEEDVYIKTPDGGKGGEEGKVCKLKKSLYGLKQASRQWNLELKRLLKKHDFRQCKRDNGMFIREKNGKSCLVYVDDLLMTGDDEHKRNEEAFG